MKLQEGIASVATAAGIMETFHARPARRGPFAPVILYMDVWGVREELYDIAREVAAEGYCCLVPDVFYRLGKVRFDARNAQGRVVSVSRLPKDLQDRIETAILRTPNAFIAQDTGALLSHFAADTGLDCSRVGCFGYCMGGRHALYAAASFPDRFRAAASLHGTLLISARDDSPHLLVDRIRAEVYCGFGQFDPHTPPELVGELRALMQSCGVAYHSQVHPGASHGYALPERDVYDAGAAARDWSAILEMFRRHLS